jgi:hypothetical protein
LQTIREFIEYAVGVYPKLGKPSPVVPDSFFKDEWQKKLDKKKLDVRRKNPYHKAAGKKFESDLDLSTLNHLVFEAVGSNNNPSDFVVCDATINSIKGKLWQGIAPMANARFDTIAKRVLDGRFSSNHLHSVIRAVSHSIALYTDLS